MGLLRIYVTNVLLCRAEEHVIAIDEHQESDAEAGSEPDEADEHNRHRHRDAAADAHTAEAATGTHATVQSASGNQHGIEQ